MPDPRRILVVTGTRAEYGLLYWLLRDLDDDPDIALQLVVTGAHLSPEFGLTYRTIIDDGFHIDDRVEMLLSGDTESAVTKSVGLAMIGFADSFARLRPDIVVLLGDRVEILAAASAALIARIPVAHIHGGELTQGAIDDAIRHAVTKMAHIHFVAAEPYRQRVVQLGEDPARVFDFGAPGLDHVERLPLLEHGDLERKLGVPLDRPMFLVTYHPATLSALSPEKSVGELLRALERFDATLLITEPNADAGSRRIIACLEAFRDANAPRVHLTASLGQVLYLSALRAADVVVGNSSSGIIEAPAFRVPTVNIGDRQRGRLRASTVIDCPEQEADIVAAIEHVLSPEFQRQLTDVQSPYGRGAGRRIAKTLKRVELDGITSKGFYDFFHR